MNRCLGPLMKFMLLCKSPVKSDTLDLCAETSPNKIKPDFAFRHNAQGCGCELHVL